MKPQDQTRSIGTHSLGLTCGNLSVRCWLGLAGCYIWLTLGSLSVRAAGLLPGGLNDYRMGSTVSVSGNMGLAGAPTEMIANQANRGAAYSFRSLDTVTGTVTENVKLGNSDGVDYSAFGWSVSAFGNTALVGAFGTGSNAAYVFRNLDTATGTVTENVKLVASDSAAIHQFGDSVSKFGSMGLVGADDGRVDSADSGPGAAYLYRGLDTASGTVTENVKLAASDGVGADLFGHSVSLSGSTGLVGAVFAKIGNNSRQGAAYLFRNLNTASGTVTENVKLTAGDGAASDFFGRCVSVSGSAGLVGADESNSQRGAAYVFRNLDTASGAVTQNAKLVASDGETFNHFGESVSLSGSTGLVGAGDAKIGTNFGQGAAYLFRNLDSAIGTVTQNVKLTASDGASAAQFGSSVSLDGDQFMIGAYGTKTGTQFVTRQTGKAYSGSVASVTTLDAGNTTKIISGFSFVSPDDWIIGQTTSGNQVTLSKGDTANVTAAGKGIYIGKTAGSNNNRLLVQGTVTASSITAGISGATGNQLEIANNFTTTEGKVTAAVVTLSAGSTLLLSGSTFVTDRLGDATALTLAGGIFNTGGLREGTATGAGSAGVPTTGLGALTLSASSVIDFGAGTSVLTFGDSHLVIWIPGMTLSIYNWSGAGGDADRLFFGTTGAGLSPTQLSQVSFYTGNGTGLLGTAAIGSNGELEAIPEPGALALVASMGFLSLAGLRPRQRGPAPPYLRRRPIHKAD